ncbi:MAG: hypothetical protein HKN47_13875 [Pirellulaceae bacterium]|nr:hypothetical protein [Pirellulaceae bacterium]
MKTPSVQPLVRSRLLPRISFRMMFALTTVAAVLAAIARVAGSGGQLASAAVSGAAFVLGAFAVFLFLFLVAWSAAMFRIPTAIAAIGLSLIAALSEFATISLPSISNWPLVFFLGVGGICLLLFPPRDPDVHSHNPFAEGQLPPQILPPREPSS